MSSEKEVDRVPGALGLDSDVFIKLEHAGDLLGSDFGLNGIVDAIQRRDPVYSNLLVTPLT